MILSNLAQNSPFTYRMKRLPASLAKIAERLFFPRGGIGEPQSADTRPASAKPLALTFRAAEDAAAATEQLFTQARKIEDAVNDIRAEVGLAWQYQSRASQEYYDLVRGVLLALDDLRELAAREPALTGLVARLEGLLREQDIMSIPVAAGDSFCADIHVCERTEPSPDVAPGRVLAVLSPGYRRRLSSGEAVVVRPVQVVVSQSPAECEEQKP
jgi:molecular chaperone GrpE (heat shock protein)